jgi:hypothetical protein
LFEITKKGNIVSTNAMSHQSIKTLHAESCKISREPQGSPNEPSSLEKGDQQSNTERCMPQYVEKKRKHYDGQPKKDDDTVSSISNAGKAVAGTDDRRSGTARDQADYDSTEDNYNKEFYEVEAKFCKECESKTYSDYSSSDSEWKPHGGWPDPSLSPRSEGNRRNLEKTRREYKSRAWGIKEAAKRGSQLAKSAPNHPVAPVKEGIINASGVVEPFAAHK